MNPTPRMLLFLAVALLVACTPARRELPENNIIRHIEFEGNGGSFSGHNDLQLRQQLESEQTRFGLLLWPLMYFVEPKLLKPELFPREAYRLETWYAHNGWFDAQVVGWQMRRIREIGPRRAGVVDVVGFVRPGEPSLVRNLEIRGLEGPLELLGSAAVRNGDIREGSQYSLTAAEDLRRQILDNLWNHSRAYADVTIQSAAFPEDHAVDVTLTADPGISTRFGRITITGNDKVPTRMIASAIPFQMGQTYRVSDLGKAQQRLYGMSTFSIVDIEPDLSDPTEPLVPIQVNVTESKFRRLRIGFGGDVDSKQVQNTTTLLDPTGISPRVSMNFTHVNLFRQLIRWEASASAGFDYVYTDDAGMEFQETFALRSSLTYPRILGQRLAIELRGQLVQDVQSGLWAYLRQEADMHLVWNAYNDVQFRAGPHIEQYRYLFESAAQSDAALRFFGEGFENPYQLTSLDEYVIVDLRDDKFDTTRGAFYSGRMRQAVPILHKGTTYGSVALDGRWYRPVRLSKKFRDFPLVVALGARGEFLQSLGRRAIPYPERTFMGGANSIRGFRQDQVGPYDTLCSYDPTSEQGLSEPVSLFHLPHGGTLGMQTSAELRYRWINGITLATFFDIGSLTDANLDDVLDGTINFRGFTDSLRMSGGVGTRYASPVGPIRLDISFRRLYPEDFGPNLFVNCRSEDDQQGRVSDFFSAFPRYRDALDRPPFAMVFFIAIGESI